MTTASEGYWHAYTHWLRSGRWVRSYGFDGRELKFNPYHDPRNGQFTFAPGGPRSLSHIVISAREGRRPWVEPPPEPSSGRRQSDVVEPPVDTSPSGEVPAPNVQFAQRWGGPSMRRGSNSRAFDDPMTLEQAFPGLTSTPGGATVALADNLLDFRGPARALTTALAQEISGAIIRDIQSLIPQYRSN